MARPHYTNYLDPKDFANPAAIDWFSNCGDGADCAENCILITDLAQAMAKIGTIDYENFQLERQNDITVHLTARYKNEYSDWNKHNQYIKEMLQEAFKQVELRANELGFEKVVVDSVKWDLVDYYQEKVFKKYRIPIYFHNVFSIYQAGKLPCGYEGNYPNGKLCIY